MTPDNSKTKINRTYSELSAKVNAHV